MEMMLTGFIMPNQQSIRCSEISLWVYHIINYIFNGVVSWNHGEISDCIRFSKLNLHWTGWRGWIWMLQKPPHETNHGRSFPSGTPSETLPRGIGGVHSGVIFRSSVQLMFCINDQRKRFPGDFIQFGNCQALTMGCHSSGDARQSHQPLGRCKVRVWVANPRLQGILCNIVYSRW